MKYFIYLIIFLFIIFYGQANAAGSSWQGKIEAFSYEVVCPEKLTAGALKNLAYKVHIYGSINSDKRNDDPPFTLEQFKNGKTRDGDAFVAASSFGDLTGNKTNDAAIIVSEFNGGNGNDSSVCVLSASTGKCTIYQAFLAFPPIQIDAVQIKKQHVFVSLRYRGPGEPTCCPTKKGTLEFKLGPGGLELVKGVHFPRVW